MPLVLDLIKAVEWLQLKLIVIIVALETAPVTFLTGSEKTLKLQSLDYSNTLHLIKTNV